MGKPFPLCSSLPVVQSCLAQKDPAHQEVKVTSFTDSGAGRMFTKHACTVVDRQKPISELWHQVPHAKQNHVPSQHVIKPFCMKVTLRPLAKSQKPRPCACERAQQMNFHSQVHHPGFLVQEFDVTLHNLYLNLCLKYGCKL